MGGADPPDGEEALGVPDPVREGAVDQKYPEPAAGVDVMRIREPWDGNATQVTLTQ
jgi:hypothetical protein